MDKYKFDTFIFDLIRKNNFDKLKSLMETYPEYTLYSNTFDIYDMHNIYDVTNYNDWLYNLFKYSCKNTDNISIIKYIYNYSIEHGIKLFENKCIERDNTLLYIFRKRNIELLILTLNAVDNKFIYFKYMCTFFTDINMTKYIYDYSLDNGINLIEMGSEEYHILLCTLAQRQNIEIFKWILDITPNKTNIIDSKFMDELYMRCVRHNLFNMVKYMAENLKPYKYSLLMDKNIYIGRIKTIQEQKWYYTKYLLQLQYVEIPNDIVCNIVECLL